MNPYTAAFLVAGVIIPIVLHFVSPDAMPWWPDTVSMGIAFGTAALVIVWKTGKDREQRRRFLIALRGIGEAIGRSWTSLTHDRAKAQSRR